MSTTTATRPREVPLPAGVTYADKWQGDEAEMPYRFIGTADRSITDDVGVYVSAVQFADGSIDAGSIEAPAVHVAGFRIPVERVPVLISALQGALAELDGLRT